VTDYGRALIFLQKWNACSGCSGTALWDCMYGVEKTAMEWRLENCDKVDKYLKTSPLDWLNFEVSFHKTVSKSITLSFNTFTYVNAEVRRNGKTEYL